MAVRVTRTLRGISSKVQDQPGHLQDSADDAGSLLVRVLEWQKFRFPETDPRYPSCMAHRCHQRSHSWTYSSLLPHPARKHKLLAG